MVKVPKLREFMAFHPKLSVDQATAVLERRMINNFIWHLQFFGITDPIKFIKSNDESITKD